MRSVRPVRLTVTRYRLPDGSVCSKATPGAIKSTEKTDHYYARLPDPQTGKKKPVPLDTTDEAQAWTNLNALLRKRADRQAGICDDVTDQMGRPIAEHLDDWLADVEASGDVDTEGNYFRNLRRRLEKLIALAGWRLVSEITDSSARKALNRLQKDGGHHGRGRSNRTRNHYVTHLRQFVRWLVDVRPRRLREDPLTTLGPVSVETDLRHSRREPTDAELGLLFAYLESEDATTLHGLTGPQRALGYRVLMSTGLRLGELRSLTPASFDLESLTLTVQAAYSKHRRRDVQPLPEWLAKELHDWFNSGDQCWPYPEKDSELILQADLEAAGIAYSVEGPDGEEFFDHHSFRVFYASWVARQPGISPKVCMELVRHGDPKLTFQLYARTRRHELHAAVEDLPRPGKRKRKRRQA